MRKKISIDDHTMLQRNPNQIFTTVDEEVVMLNIYDEEYINMDSIASFIWHQLESPQSFSELVEKLCVTYEVKKEICIKDSREFVTELIEKKIVMIIYDKDL